MSKATTASGSKVDITESIGCPMHPGVQMQVDTIQITKSIMQECAVPSYYSCETQKYAIYIESNEDRLYAYKCPYGCRFTTSKSIIDSFRTGRGSK